VSGALPRALKVFGDIRVIIPGYRQVLRRSRHLEIIAECDGIGDLPPCQLGLSRAVDGLPIYVVMCPQLYDRTGGPYADEQQIEWPDNDLRFARFASVAASLAAGRLDPNWSADLLHGNDWQSGLAAAYLAWNGWNLPSLLTIHNLAYQGLYDKSVLPRIGAPASAFAVEGMEFYGKASFLKAGLVYATHLTTVSETYAREITMAEHGCGLDGVLRQRSESRQLTGILNGIDEDWDPRTCRDLANRFASGEWDAKQTNADHVRREFGLALSRGPLFGLVARLVHQKGIDFVLEAAETIVNAGGQIVVTGRGDPALEKELAAAQRRRPDAIAAAIRYDEGEAKRIFAGSDFTLMPSRFEPCGLSQMYAQRFGSLPIGHKTGGLAETIVDGKTGFLFSEPSTRSFLGGIRRAMAAFASREKLNAMRSDAMSQPFGWNNSAAVYDALYQQVAA
jgi:starch synthase